MSPTGIPTDAEFTFSRSLRDIKAADSAVPRVDPETVAEYGALGLVDRFYVGRTDGQGRLRRLETWDRLGVEDLPLDTVIAGQSLAEHEIPIRGRDVETQVPLFFLPDGTGWRQVAAAETAGETRFIRLRLLKPLEGETLVRDAEVMEQALSLIESYTYDDSGRLVEMLRQRRETDFAVERILGAAP